MLNLLLFSLLSYLHPLHLSTTEIEYSEKNQALQIISRIFVDDLELAIQNAQRQEDLDILHPNQPGLSTESLVWEYLKHHFRVKLDGKLHPMKFIGCEDEENFVLVCYLEIENVSGFTNIEVFNASVMEMYQDQSNIIHVTYKDTLKSVRLVYENRSAVLVF